MVVEIAGDGAPGNFGLTSYIGVGFLVEGVWVADWPMLTVKSFTVQAGSFDFCGRYGFGTCGTIHQQQVLPTLQLALCLLVTISRAGLCSGCIEC